MLILTEQDPLQCAFKLSHEFRQLSMIEIEFREEYLELVKVLDKFCCDLIAQAWTSMEMEAIMQFNHSNKYLRLELLKKAQKYRQGPGQNRFQNLDNFNRNTRFYSGCF